MEKDTIYYVLGALAFIYLLIGMRNRRQAKGRKNRKFMDNYKRREDKE